MLCRASTWPLPQLLDAAVAHYLDLNKRLPPVIRVHPKNLKATQEHFKAQKWSAIGIQTCGGVLACEIEIPYQEGVTQCMSSSFHN